MRSPINSLLIALSLAFVSFLTGCTTDVPPENISSSPYYERLLLPGGNNAITLRIHFVDGLAPSEITLEGLNKTILEITGKSTVLDYFKEFPEQFPGYGGTYTSESLRNVLAQAIEREPPQVEDQLVLRLIYLDGSHEDGRWGQYSGEGNILVFLERMDGYLPTSVYVRGTGVNEFRPLAERSVVVHELGHAFGLVDCGIPMVTPRATPDSPCHSEQEDSVMYPEVVDPGPIELIRGNFEPVWHFNAADLQDIRAFQYSVPVEG